MKVLIVTNMYPSIEKKYSGIFVKNQYEELLKLKSNEDVIDIFFMKRRFTSFVGSLIKYLNAIFTFIPKLMKKYDVVHLHYFYPLISLVWFYKILHPKTKLVVTFHGSDINLQVTDKNVLFFRFLAKKIDFSIPVGNQVAMQVKSKLKINIGKILPVGINEKVFYKNKLIKKYDFIFVGSFFKVKGIDTLYNSIKSLNRDVRFCIVGKGEEYESKFLELEKKGYNVTLKIDQNQDQLRDLYNESKFLFLPSRSEGFPTVTIEAMYCGTPVLTSNIDQFKEQVIEGQNGFTINVNNEMKLYSKMIELKTMDEASYESLVLSTSKYFKDISLTSICNQLYLEYLKLYRNEA